MDNNDIPTAVEELRTLGLITIRLYYGLTNLGIVDICELEGFGIDNLRMTRGWGKGMIGEISALAKVKGISI